MLPDWGLNQLPPEYKYKYSGTAKSVCSVEDSYIVFFVVRKLL